MKKTHPAYSELKELSITIQTYSSILSLLSWDQETYMPPGGIVPRSEQISLLSGHIHDLKTGRHYKGLLEKLVSISTGKIKVKGLSKLDRIVIREWHRDFERQAKLPSAFVKTFSQTTSEASQIWQTAKRTNNFKLFAPFLQRIVELSREKASIYGYDDHPYDALLSSYEPCMTSAKLKTIFGSLRKELVHLLDKIKNSKQIDDRFLKGKFAPEKQIALGKELLSKLPLEPTYTRLDLSAHPFSTALHPHDSRITTRILPTGFMSNLFSVLHEAGHSLYEMGLPAQYFGTPLAEAISSSVHESQSRWWENLIGRSLPFWKQFYPMVQNTFPSRLEKVSCDHFYHAVNKVESSLIRVEADEVTYCLHVILRFELEMDLISGTLQVTDLPEAWRAKTKELLGIVPETDTEGCLQDIHWSLGDFGYFPTYALGNLLASHFFETFEKKYRNWKDRIAKQGDLTFIADWLKTNVHSLGKQYDLESLAKHVTGKSFSEAAYCRYLKKKYGEVYRLKSS